MTQTDPFHAQYRELTDEEKALVASVKDQAAVLYETIEKIKDGREKSVAKTNLEQSVMWAVKGITA